MLQLMRVILGSVTAACAMVRANWPFRNMRTTAVNIPDPPWPAFYKI